jgi:polyphosphate kinase
MSSGSIRLTERNYVDRDISWLYFNYRILKEAKKKEVPVYEKLNFLGIYSSNLDEFYRVRVAALKKISESNVSRKEEKKKVLKQIAKISKQYSMEYDETVRNTFQELSTKGVILLDEKNLDEEQKTFIEEYYRKNISGYIQPIILSKKANLTSVTDMNIYLACRMKKKENSDVSYALIPLPVRECSRFVVLPDKDKKHYVMYIDDVVRYHLKSIFPCLEYDEIEAYAFKFSRNAEMEIESDPEEGILKNILQAVKDRKKGLPVRTIFATGTPDDLIKAVTKKLDIPMDGIVSVSGKYHNNKDLMKFPYFTDLKNAKYPSWPKEEFIKNGSLIDEIQNSDKMIHVPYQSFDAFIEFLKECSISKDVSQIKATIYRAAKDSKVVSSLANAAINGKKVTCMVELMARFDESSNVSISKRLMDAGCEILSCKEGFKIHGKVVLVKMKNKKDMAIISTGNFHEGNAKAYTDCLLFTSDKRIVSEVEKLFDFLAHPYKNHTFHNLLVSPNHMLGVFQKLIRNEINNANIGKPAHICMKVNHITDEKIIQSLYLAASKGVKIDLLVRGNCSIRRGIPFIDENIHIHGIIDRYLEHSRIFIFENDGNPLFFMGSADLMPRNLYNRVEVITPVYDEKIQKELSYIFNIGFNDNVSATIATGDGEYIPFPEDGKKKVRSQLELSRHYRRKS